MVEPVANYVSETITGLLNHCEKNLNDSAFFYLYPADFLLSFDILIVEITLSNSFKNRLLSDIFLPSMAMLPRKYDLLSLVGF